MTMILHGGSALVHLDCCHFDLAYTHKVYPPSELAEVAVSAYCASEVSHRRDPSSDLGRNSPADMVFHIGVG
jgi:hypothetical protein